MQQKDLHKLGKTDLLTLIYKQEKQIQQLTKEVEDLKHQLEDRTIQMKEAGSIAEASLKINKIFEVAQQAADEYLKSIKEVNKPSHECAQIDEDTTKDESKNVIQDKALSQNTYEKQFKYRIKRYKKQTKEKVSKELVLVNNEIMEIKPKFLKRVVILLMFIAKKISVFMKINVNNVQFFMKKVKMSNKIIFIKLKHDIIKIIGCIKSIYYNIEQHMKEFGDYCELQFPSTMSTISYKIYVKRKKLKIFLGKLNNKCKIKLKLYIKQISKFIKFIRIKGYDKIVKFCRLNKKIYKKVILHLRVFIKYCDAKFTILRFKIRNLKSYKKKLLGQASDAIIPNRDNTLMIIKNRTILYHKILRTSKKYLQKLKYFTIMIFTILCRYIKKECKVCKSILNKICCHLKEFCIYCKEQIVVLKIKISNKIHHVKQINEINENVHIEPTKDALIKVNTDVIRFKTKLLAKILLILKKCTRYKIIKKKKKKKMYPVQNFFSKIKEKKKIKEVEKQTHEAIVKNMEISIQEIEEELKKRKNRKVKIKFIKTLSYSAMVIIAFAIITSTSFFKILQVSGSSMEPNLHEGELLITSSFFKFEKGDMIAFYYNDSVLIKRVIATEGDVINIEDDGTVFVNSVKLEENYVKELSYGNCDITFPYQVPKNSVFILGDNRGVSIDSRSKAIGCISKDKIIGKIKFKLNPFVIY